MLNALLSFLGFHPRERIAVLRDNTPRLLR